MDNSLSELMNSTLSNIEDLVKVNNIVGEPIVTPDGITLIPISKVSFGFGGGGGDFSSNSKSSTFGGGSAAGVKIEPIGFLVVKDGSVRMVNITPAKNSVDKALELVPQVLDRVDRFIDDKK